MSLLKWKEMAEKRSELGKKINTVRETIKQKTISDQMGEVEAEKLFKPITSGLKDLTFPEIPVRRLPKKNGPVPDYSLEIGDDEDVPDYNLEGLFGDQVLPQDDKQLVPKPPTYEDVLKDLSSGEFMYGPEDLPPEYEQEVPDYEIHEEDKINHVLDGLEIPNYDRVKSQLEKKDINDKERKSYLKLILKNAKETRQQINGKQLNVTKKLNSGTISKALAQYQMKEIRDKREVINDYINYNNEKLNDIEQKLKDIKGSGLKKKTKRGGQVMFFNNPTEMIKKLELIIGSMIAGNNSIELRNTGVALLDILLKNAILNRPQYNKIYKNYFSLN